VQRRTRRDGRLRRIARPPTHFRKLHRSLPARRRSADHAHALGSVLVLTGSTRMVGTSRSTAPTSRRIARSQGKRRAFHHAIGRSRGGRTTKSHGLTDDRAYAATSLRDCLAGVPCQSCDSTKFNSKTSACLWSQGLQGPQPHRAQKDGSECSYRTGPKSESGTGHICSRTWCYDYSKTCCDIKVNG